MLFNVTLIVMIWSSGWSQTLKCQNIHKSLYSWSHICVITIVTDIVIVFRYDKKQAVSWDGCKIMTKKPDICQNNCPSLAVAKILWLQKLSKEGWIWRESESPLLTLEWWQRTQKRIITSLQDRRKTTQSTWTINTGGVQYPKSLLIRYEGILENIWMQIWKISTSNLTTQSILPTHPKNITTVDILVNILCLQYTRKER